MSQEGTPMTDRPTPSPLTPTLPIDDLCGAWGLKDGDTHRPEARYRREAWWFQNQRGDSLHVTPDDVAVLLDDLAAVATIDAARAGVREPGYFPGDPQPHTPYDGCGECIAHHRDIAARAGVRDPEGRPELVAAAQAVVAAWVDDESGMETFDPALIDTLAAALHPTTDDPHTPECAVNHPEPDADFVKCDCGAIPPHRWDPEAFAWVVVPDPAILDRLMELWQQPWSEPAFGEAQVLVARLRRIWPATPADETPKEPTP